MELRSINISRLERLETYALGLKQGKIDGRIFAEAESLCDSYAIHDPSVTLETVQRVAIIHMTALRAFDSHHETHFAANPFVLSRLVHLSIDPETLEVVHQS